MYEINWNRFVIKNPDAQTAFETMCRNLFLRKYKISGYEFSSNYNQAGIEIEPILSEAKYHGFQCKYSVSGNNNAFYKELFDSLTKAINIYPNLGTVIIYTNLDIKPNPTLLEQKNTRNSCRIKIFELAKENNIHLIWVCKNNFESILNEITNFDLYRLYFSPQDESGFLSTSLTTEDRTFLASNQFVDLPVNNSKFSQIQDDLLASTFSIITGAAGTGKSEILKKLFLRCENDFLINKMNCSYETVAPIPIFIRLRDCTNGNLEELLRNRLRDFEIAVEDNSRSFIYFFDGIDEISPIDFNGVSACLMRLSKKQKTKSIVLSSRTNTSNLTTVYREFEAKNFSIDSLTITDIENYFENCKDLEKIDQFKNIKNRRFHILADITDIFSVVLLWKNIGQISNITTKIDLISLSVNILIERSRKYAVINLPEPKVASIDTILSNVSAEMHRSKCINISRADFQKIVNKHFPNTSYLEVDAIVDYICEIFFDSYPSSTLQQVYSYRHKRYFEFYLYRVVKKMFYEDPSILRELNLLSNKDFMLNIFLTQELKDNIDNKDLHKVLILRFLEDYLGRDYIKDKKSPQFAENVTFAGGSESYIESPQLRDYLCSKEYDDLYTFLRNDPLSICSFLRIDNYWSFVKRYYEVKQKDIRILLDDVFKFSVSYEEEAASKDPYSYCFCKCMMDDVPIERIYQIAGKKGYENIEHDLEYISVHFHNDTSRVVQFFEMAIEFFPVWTSAVIGTLSTEQLEIICFVLLKTRMTRFLFSESTQFVNVRNAICDRIASNKEESYKINTVVLYSVLTHENMQQEDIEKRIRKVNISHYGTWEHNLELNSYSAILLKENFQAAYPDLLLGISIRGILIENYPENEESILKLILEEVKKCNLIYNNWFSYSNSLLIGEVLACLSFEVKNTKHFVSELRKYQNVISLFTVLYKIMEKNIDLFKAIANQRLINSSYDYIKQSTSYYDSNSDNGFMYATMISYFDLIKGDALFESALNNSIFRPMFRKENMIAYYLPLCLMDAYENDWLSMSELEKAIGQVYKMLEISKDTLDSGAYFDYFKFLTEKCLDDSSYLSKLHEFTSRDPYENEQCPSGLIDINVELLTVDNISQYYDCKVEGIKYSSMLVWKTLINYEFHHDPELKILYRSLDKNYFPEQTFNKINDCFHIITAILITDVATKDGAIQYIMNRGGRLGLINMIRAFTCIGDDACARQYIESLLGLCEALVYPNKGQLIADREEWDHSTHVIDIVCNSNREEWNVDEDNKRMIFTKNPKVSICWDETDQSERFHEDWATHHPDSSAFKVKYYINYDRNVINIFDLVHVDGFRALIPMPNYATQSIKRKDYLFGCLLTDNIKNYRNYIARSGLSVE